jgi:phospholipid/cholesterol/gamma-HCH transport system ATP-binding protein
MRSAYRVGDRLAMLYRGTVRQVGTVDQIRQSHDAVVRQFIEGRPEAAADAERATMEALA